MTPPPIASPHVAEEAPSKAPFLGLRVFVAVDLVVLLLSPLSAVFSTDTHKASWPITLGFFAIYIPLWCLLLWRLWHGSGVARAIFWWVNAVSLALVLAEGFHLDHLPLWLQWINYGTTGFLVFGLVWLHLPGVKAHFRREGVSEPG